MIDYKKPSIWDQVWSKPYSRYELHHQEFWKRIRKEAKGNIIDLGCGSASCWRGYESDYDSIMGIDFSFEACKQAHKNCPNASFLCLDITDTGLIDSLFNTVVLSGIINYYENLEPILNEAKRLVKDDGIIIITINKIKDFPDREWTIERIIKEFSMLGELKVTFINKTGWFIKINVVKNGSEQFGDN